MVHSFRLSKPFTFTTIVSSAVFLVTLYSVLRFLLLYFLASYSALHCVIFLCFVVFLLQFFPSSSALHFVRVVFASSVVLPGNKFRGLVLY